MRSIDETFETFGKRVLWLGYAGEEDRSTLIVDLHDILLEFPGATAVLKVRPPDEKAAYPAVTETIDDKLHWSISDSDTAKEGRGELQLSLISPTGSKIKTAVAAMEISRSLPDGGKKPDRIDDWMEKAEAARKKAEEAASTADTATNKANEATSKANTAASNADTKAKPANDAATKATDAAKKAEDAAEKADKAHQNILIGSETGNPVSVSDAFSAPLCGLTVYGRSTQDGTPSPDNPVPIVSAGDGGTIGIKTTGKNLISTEALFSPTKTAFVVIDGHIKGTTTTKYAQIGYLLQSGYPAQYTASVSGGSETVETELRAYKWVDGKLGNLVVQGYFSVGQRATISFSTDGKSEYFVFFRPYGVSDFDYYDMQLEIGATATSFELYQEQTLTLPTPNGLPGVPVTSGGNYTDQSGQQWVCDEVDLERGVKVQRVTTVDLSTCTSVGTVELAVTKRITLWLPFKCLDTNMKALCNKLQHVVSFIKDSPHFYIDATRADVSIAQVFIPIGAKNPEEGEYILFYALATPIETPLTPDELAAYKALTTYAPNTVVQASDGAGLKLDYQRDVNIVIKNLEDAIASMTTT